MRGLVPREITPTDVPCARCGATLVLTRDAIGRPRPRCPQCQQVNTTPMAAGIVGTQHSQSAADSRSLPWPRPRLAAHVHTVGRRAAGSHARRRGRS